MIFTNMRAILTISLACMGVALALPHLSQRQAANDNIVYITEYVILELTHSRAYLTRNFL